MNVQDDGEGMALLRSLGARSVPVVSRGARWVSGHVLNDIAELLDLDERTAPALEPAELIERLDVILSAAQRYLLQFDPKYLDENVRGRQRTLRELGYHIFRIPDGFLEVVDGQVAALEYGALTAAPPDDVRDAAHIAAYGDAARAKIKRWWQGFDEADAGRELATYYGPQTVHELLERTTWHCGQHVRQLMLLLDEDHGIAIDGPVGAEVFEGLPMPREAWDG